MSDNDDDAGREQPLQRMEQVHPAASRGPPRGLTPADAAAAAASHRDRMVSAVRKERPPRAFEDLHSSEQVVCLDEHELWPTIASQWCRPGGERIEEFAATWGGDDLAAVVYHLGLSVKPRNGRRDYWEKAMRQQVVDAVRAFAAEHPEVFEPERRADSPAPDEHGEEERASAQSSQRSRSSPPRGDSPLRQRVPPSSPGRGRRSPRGSAASRSADAMKALGQVPLVGRALERAERDSPEPVVPKRSPAARAKGRGACQEDPPRVRLLELGRRGGSPSSSDGSGSDDSADDSADGDWAQDDDDAAAASSARRGGRLLRDEFDSRLAETGVQRHSFAKGFLRNAMREAAGRTLYQLYKDTTSQWENASVHCKREALAHARTLDCLLQASSHSRAVRDALEHVCRRLGGVHTAATTGSWDMCDRLEAQTSVHSFVPDAFMSAALKQVTREQAIRKSVSDGYRAGKSSYPQGTGRNKPRGGYSGPKSGSGGPTGAAATGEQPGAGSSSHKSGGGKSGSRKK